MTMATIVFWALVFGVPLYIGPKVWSWYQGRKEQKARITYPGKASVVSVFPWRAMLKAAGFLGIIVAVAVQHGAVGP